MKKIISICIMVVLLLGNSDTAFASNNKEYSQYENFTTSSEDGFRFEIVKQDTKETRDYARNFTYTVYVQLGNVIVGEYDIALSYSYTNNTVVVSNLSCTKGYVLPEYSVTVSKNITNGNPAYAKLVFTAKKDSTGLTNTGTFVFVCKVSGNVEVIAY